MGDLTLDSRGNVFATDSLTPAIYTIGSKDDELRLFLDRGPFVSPQGLTFSPDEKLMFMADYSLGLFAIDTRTKQFFQLRPMTNTALVGIDGLYFYRGNLIGIQNGTNPHRVVRLRLSKGLDHLDGLEILEANNPVFDEPTLGVLVADALYFIADSQWGKVDKNGKLTAPELLRDVTVLKVALAAGNAGRQ